MKKHFSHQHALKLHSKSNPNGDSECDDDQVICSICDQLLYGTADDADPPYSCTKRDCDFFIHKSCSDLPRKMQHKSHMDHPLELFSEPPEEKCFSYFDCNACGEVINAFSFYCRKCDFRIHVKCALLPQSVQCKAHKHALELRYSLTKGDEVDDGMAFCSVCLSCVSDCWSYYCKDCDFCTDLECATSADVPIEEEEEEEEEGEREEKGGENETSVKHFSHPHGLQFHQEFVRKEDDEIEAVCEGCRKQLCSGDSAYACRKPSCEFFLHKSCFELPMNLDHKAHANHHLQLLSEPPEYSAYYDCSACGNVIDGFSYQCEKCDGFRLHVICAFLPESVKCKWHKHEADLVAKYSTPAESSNEKNGDGIYCGVCEEEITEEYWSYYCKECEFSTHFECAAAAENDRQEEAEDDEEEDVDEEDDPDESDAMKLLRANIKLNDQMARLRFQRQMADLNARTMASICRTYNYY